MYNTTLIDGGWGGECLVLIETVANWHEICSTVSTVLSRIVGSFLKTKRKLERKVCNLVFQLQKCHMQTFLKYNTIYKWPKKIARMILPQAF